MCGGDHFWSIINQLSTEFTRVISIRKSRNYGQHNALLAGVRAGNGALIITLDDDLQHPPEEIPKLVDRIYCGYDVIYGSQIEAQQSFF
ncbi:MAG: glycosyltransferase [Legionella sp.]|nr:glycosyltransferase [Legionella sp.]